MKKVLVADDTKNIRTLLSTCLEIEGYEVVIAKDGQDALDKFAAHDFSLAFLDIKMPEMSGTEVLKRIREMGIHIPVIIITAFATVKNAVECTKMGAVAYLQKPFTADKVRGVLKELEDCSGEVIKENASGQYIEKIERLIGMENYQEAITELKRALAQEPTNGKVYYLLSKAYLGIGDTENAKKFYTTYELFGNSKE